MYSIPHDPALPALQELFPAAGVPSFVVEMVQEMSGTPVNPETARLCHVRYRPTRNCVVLWSFPRPLNRPFLVSGLLSDSLGKRTADPFFQRSAATVRADLGGDICPYKHLPDRQLLLEVFPLDIRLPGLALAASSSWARDAFSQFLGLPLRDVCVAETVPVSYKPWRRCVLRYVVEIQGRLVRYFGKVFRDDRGALMVERLQALRTQLLASGSPWDIAVPVTYVPEARMLVLGAREESVELSPLLRKALQNSEARETLREQITRVAEGLCVFQRMVLEGMPWVDPREVLTEYEKEFEGILQVAPALGQSIQVRLRRLDEAASRLPAEAMVPSHGAFRYNQFLRCDNRLIALDLDALCLSGISADAGEFLAYLDLCAIRRPRLRAVLSECEEVFLAAVLKQRRVDPRWLAWYRAAGHVKWAHRSFFSLDPEWPERTSGLLQLADHTLVGLPA